MNKVKITRFPISRQINENFKDYAIYTLCHRGIPDFNDSLTNIQRLILLSAKNEFTKSISVIGDVIKNGYHHGNCLDGATEINLANGETITIEEWYKNKPNKNLLVRSFDVENNKEVSGIGHSPRVGVETEEYYEIELENGEIIKCTDEHPFLVNGKWIFAKDLKEEDDITNL